MSAALKYPLKAGAAYSTQESKWHQIHFVTALMADVVFLVVLRNMCAGYICAIHSQCASSCLNHVAAVLVGVSP